jgi:hypothetical protein
MMSDHDQEFKARQDQTIKFLKGVFGVKHPKKSTPAPDLTTVAPLPLSAEMPVDKNQPEFWADAPWRLEPDQNEILLLFLVRDTNIEKPAKGPWRLDVLKIQQWVPGVVWDDVLALLPADLPKLDGNGMFQLRTWWHSLKIPLAKFKGAVRGKPLRLRVGFHGSYYPYDKPSHIYIHLEIFLAEHALPLSRAASSNQPRRWFYGDTHYHSVYTNDIKELGNPVPESCTAAHAVGLDWLVITDHSCDLDDVDPDVSPQTRWERLKADTANPNISNNQFRCILGEEITLLGKGDNLVHMLAFGSMDKMVEGAFLPDQGGFMTEVLQETIQTLLHKAAKKGGYSKDEAQRMFGKVHPFEEILTMLPAETLLFAAHPFQLAQPPPPGKWVNEHLYHPRLTGFEFWNARIRRSAHLTLNPFESKKWSDPAELLKHDQKRIEMVKGLADVEWELALRQGLATWGPADAAPSLRPVFLAGTDAHGSFNYSVGMSWDYRRRLIVDDDALGKVRTVVYLPEAYTDAIPPEAEILAAMRKGSCVVTDGPIVTFSVEQQGKTAQLGDVLNVSDSQAVNLNIQAFTTLEFGPVEQVELVTCFRHYRKPVKTILQKGETVTIQLDGSQGYCRLFAQTAGPDGELFCCFTNPIWIQGTCGQDHKLLASFA